MSEPTDPERKAMLAQHRAHLCLAVLVIASTFAIGCQGNRQGLLAPPGTMQAQQQRATVYDPFADNDAGPEIVGGRPREFQKPLPEPVRARNFDDPIRARSASQTRWPF